MPWIPIALAAVQVGAGIIQGAKAKKDANKLLAQREAYKTPPQVTDILNATKANASTGFNAQTLDYLNNQTMQSFSSSIGTAQRLGADPNVLSSIFHQNVDNIIRVGIENNMANTQNFSAFLNSLNASGASSAAEQKSQQDILKDRLQQAATGQTLASQQVSAGLNTALSAYSIYKTGQLYNRPTGVNNTGYFNPLEVSTQPRNWGNFTPLDEQLPR